MLNLKSQTPAEWVRRIEPNLDQVLIDHAHCEKKAARTAMSLIFAYLDDVDLAQELSRIVQEELEHFQQVLEILKRRGIAFRRQPQSSYGGRLMELVRKNEPGRAIDRCIVAALIEARSCERFSVLKEHLTDRELATYYGELMISEARHYTTYIRFAQRFASKAEVEVRFIELAEAEAHIIQLGDTLPRLHS